MAPLAEKRSTKIRYFLVLQQKSVNTATGNQWLGLKLIIVITE